MRTIRIINNKATIYDWNKGGGFVRSSAILLEQLRTGLNDSHGFNVYYYGLGKLKE